MFQHGALFPWKTVLENVIYGPIVQGTAESKRGRAEGARELLADAGLPTSSDNYPGELSAACTGASRSCAR